MMRQFFADMDNFCTHRTLTPAELKRVAKLHWGDILLLAANRTARWQVEINEVTAPILERLK